MGTRGRNRRIGGAWLLAVTASACAARTATPVLRPFPSPAPPASLRPGHAGAPRVVSLAALTQTALSLKGVPYVWGGDRPGTGFDCSGFVRYVLAQHHVAAPRAAAEQFRLGTDVDRTHIRAGDLVFFSTVAPGPSHVGLAINGEEFIHAPATSGVVRVERIQASYWRSRYIGARRLF